MGDCLDQPCTYLQDRTFEIIPENFVDGLCPSPIITRSCLEANPTNASWKILLFLSRLHLVDLEQLSADCLILKIN